MPNVEFDAGNAFGNPLDAVTADTSDTSAPEATETEASEGTEDAAGDEPQTSSWADPNPEEAENEAAKTGDAKAAARKAPTAAEIQIKGGKGVHKFKLDPNDPQLQTALKLGMGARQWQRERDEARKELGQLKSQSASTAEKVAVWDRLEALSQKGQSDKVVRAILGDDGYANLVKQIVRETIEYDAAGPDQRTEIDKERVKRDREWTDTTHREQKQALEGKYQALEDKIEGDRLRSVGTAALQRYDFSGFVEDADMANALNNKLWKLSWSDLEDTAEGGGEITPELIQRTFAQNAKVLRAGQAKMVKAKVGKVIEGKKADATRKAQVAATERYPTGGAAKQGWDGQRSKDLLKMLVKGGR